MAKSSQGRKRLPRLLVDEESKFCSPTNQQHDALCGADPTSSPVNPPVVEKQERELVKKLSKKDREDMEVGILATPNRPAAINNTIAKPNRHPSPCPS